MNAPVASIIVPCRNVAETVEAAIAGALASPLGELEVVAVDDSSSDATWSVLEGIAARDARVRPLRSPGRGVSAARNAGLDAARGEFIFFIDADDTVEPVFFPKAVATMRNENADYCRIAHDETIPLTGQCFDFPIKMDCRLDNAADIREKLISRFFGYSFGQVREWYRGEPLWAKREMAGVWAGCYRAETIRRNVVRFDETIEIFEDAMFLCEYLLACRRTTMIDESLYHYRRSASGSMITKLAGPEFFENKLRLLAKREELDVKSGGRLTSLYSASCVFSLLEILRAAFCVKGSLFKGLSVFRRYGRDPVVKAALRHFPLSWRKPALAAAVLVCRLAFR